MKCAYFLCLCLFASTLFAQPRPAPGMEMWGMSGTRMSSDPSSASAGSIFQEAATYRFLGGVPSSVAVADVNGDGHPDLIVAECGTACRGRVGVRLGNGDGTFQAPHSYSSGGYYASSVAVADVNGDGYPDLIVVNACADSNCQNGSVGVLLGKGDGTFRAPVHFSSGGYYSLFDASSVAVADVNGDGYPDLLVTNTCVSSTNCTNGNVAVFLGRGDGTFQAPVTYNSGGPDASSLAVADVNGDGHLDLLVANGNTVAVLLGNADGTFAAPVTYGSGVDVMDSFTLSLAVADVNGDGYPDIVVGNECGLRCGSSVGVLLGNGDGTFQAVTTYATGGDFTQSIAVADVNGDGHPDVLVANGCLTLSLLDCSYFGTVAVLLGNGDGTFQAPINYAFGGERATSIAVADVSGDGYPDLIVGNVCVNDCGHGGEVSVLLGNGNGTFRAGVAYAAGLNTISIAVADVNGDGNPDLLVTDLANDDVDWGNPSGVGVYLGNGDGTFRSAGGYSALGAYASSVAVADVNGDGYLDLIVVSQCFYCSSGIATVLLGNGDGTFQDPGVSYDSGGNVPSWVAVADVNGDGHPDLIVANMEGVGVLLNNGDGTFGAPVLYSSGSGTSPSSVAVADVNGDGHPDLLVANECADSSCTKGSVAVLLGNGNGTFKAPVTYNSGGYDAFSIALADVNGDGITDVLVANSCISSSDCAYGTLGVLPGKGNGTFRAAIRTTIPIQSNRGQIGVADFNGDGKLDVAIGTGGVLLLGNGDGTFQHPHLALDIGGPGTGIAVGDFNGDGRPDLAVGSGFYEDSIGGVIVLLNISPKH